MWLLLPLVKSKALLEKRNDIVPPCVYLVQPVTIACATALKILEYVEREGIIGKAAELGRKIKKRLDEFYNRHEVIGEVRGKGPMLAMELVKDRKSKEPDRESTSKVMKVCLESGLLTLKAGLYNNVVRLHPPLTIDDELLEKGLSIMDDAFKKI